MGVQAAHVGFPQRGIEVVHQPAESRAPQLRQRRLPPAAPGAERPGALRIHAHRIAAPGGLVLRGRLEQARDRLRRLAGARLDAMGVAPVGRLVGIEEDARNGEALGAEMELRTVGGADHIALGVHHEAPDPAAPGGHQERRRAVLKRRSRPGWKQRRPLVVASTLSAQLLSQRRAAAAGGDSKDQRGPARLAPRFTARAGRSCSAPRNVSMNLGHRPS